MRRVPKVAYVSTPDIHKLAREEIAAWKPPMQEQARVVLACFIHKLTTGKDISEFFPPSKNQVIDFQI